MTVLCAVLHCATVELSSEKFYFVSLWAGFLHSCILCSLFCIVCSCNVCHSGALLDVVLLSVSVGLYIVQYYFVSLWGCVFAVLLCNMGLS